MKKINKHNQNDCEIKQFITSENDSWTCICKNTSHDAGFHPCNENGIQIEPTTNSGWINLYVCESCNRIINQDTLEIVDKPS